MPVKGKNYTNCGIIPSIKIHWQIIPLALLYRKNDCKMKELPCQFIK
jgi:hypothetical protein